MVLGYNYRISHLQLAEPQTEPQKLYHIISQRQKGCQEPTGQTPLRSRTKQRQERLGQPPKPSPVTSWLKAGHTGGVSDPSQVQGVSSARLHIYIVPTQHEGSSAQ